MAKKTSKNPKEVPLDLDAIAALLKVDIATARDSSPAYPVAAILLDADRAFAEYHARKKDFVGIPTFNPDLFAFAIDLRNELAEAERVWRLTRISKNAVDRVGLRKEAETLRLEIMASCRFVCRHDAEANLELDRIDEGDGLDDLILDLDDIVAFSRARPTVLVEGKTLPKGSLARAGELAASLRSAKEPPEAAEQRARRNLVAALVVALLKELRAVAAFRYRGNAKRIAAFSTTYASKKRAPRKAEVPS